MYIPLEAKQMEEWARKIVEAYMSWYVFFVGGNIAVLGWIHTRRVKADETVMKIIVAIFALLNFGGIISSVTIMVYLYYVVDQPLFVVIVVCGTANTLVLVALLVAWSWVYLKRTFRRPVAEW
jgi:hypothetical protein